MEMMVASVRAQSFDDYEHCIVDDGSTEPHVVPALRSAATRDSRLKLDVLPAPAGIVGATNAALAMASGEFVAFLDHDDMLHPSALSSVDAAIAAHDDIDYLYTDEDKIDSDNNHFDPFLKPDWSPERFRTQMYTCHLSVARRALVEEVGALRPGFDGAQDWDLVFRLAERARRIIHVPQVLYHWRTAPTSAAGGVEAKPWAYEAAHRVIAEHIERSGLQAQVEELPGWPGHFRLRPALRDHPLVSIVVPTGGFVRQVYGWPVKLVVNTVRSIIERSTYENVEILAVIDDVVDDGTRAELVDLGVRLVPFPREFSFSQKINVGAVHARGDYLLLLNDDVEVLPEHWRDTWPSLEGRSSWIEAMLLYALDQGVGAVGAKLYFADTRLQHVGLACTGAGPGHIYRGFPRDFGGPFNNARLPANYLALTGACLMTRRDAFENVGGFSQDFPINFNDVDYCFKLYRSGYRNVFTPDAELLHFESSSRVPHVLPEELQDLRRRWLDLLEHDPYYNPQLVQGRPNFIAPPYFRSGEFVRG